VARTLTDQFPDGVCFVGLGTVNDSARVPAEVAAALGVRQSGTRPIREVLAEVLAAQRLLLVLDVTSPRSVRFAAVNNVRRVVALVMPTKSSRRSSA
jgi:hypothetical protein